MTTTILTDDEVLALLTEEEQRRWRSWFDSEIGARAVIESLRSLALARRDLAAEKKARIDAEKVTEAFRRDTEKAEAALAEAVAAKEKAEADLDAFINDGATMSNLRADVERVTRERDEALRMREHEENAKNAIAEHMHDLAARLREVEAGAAAMRAELQGAREYRDRYTVHSLFDLIGRVLANNAGKSTLDELERLRADNQRVTRERDEAQAVITSAHRVMGHDFVKDGGCLAPDDFIIEDLGYWKADIEHLEAERDDLAAQLAEAKSTFDDSVRRMAEANETMKTSLSVAVEQRDAIAAQLREVEAGAAAMRRLLGDVGEWSVTHPEIRAQIEELLSATNAGSALLDELERLRATVREVHEIAENDVSETGSVARLALTRILMRTSAALADDGVK